MICKVTITFKIKKKDQLKYISSSPFVIIGLTFIEKDLNTSFKVLMIYTGVFDSDTIPSSSFTYVAKSFKI